MNEIIRQVDTVIGQASAAGHGILVLEEIECNPNRYAVDQSKCESLVALKSNNLTVLDSAMSGATSSLTIIGATNFPERLDEALVRPGRLNKVVRIGRPDGPATVGILRQHLGRDLADLDLGPVASICAGATGSQIAGWAKGARATARAAGRPMTHADLGAQVAPAETRDAQEVWANKDVMGLRRLGSTAVCTLETPTLDPFGGSHFGANHPDMTHSSGS